MYAWTEEELAFRDAVRSFVDKEIRPLQDDLEHEGLPPYEISRKFYKAFGLDEAAAEYFEWQIRRDEAAAAGEAFDEPQPEGGVGGGPIANIELAKVGLGIPTAIGISAGMVGGTINSLGTVEQRRRWARDVMTLAKIGAWAITEPDAGSDAFGGMRTTAKPDGNGGWVINGQKTFISNGPYADTIIVYCKLDDGSEPDRRKQPVLIFVLDADMEGLTRSKPFKKMGMSSSPPGSSSSTTSRSALTGCWPASPAPTAVSRRGRTSSANASASPRSPSASSRSANGSPSTMPSSASCGASRSASSS
ncbi:acyl-CoA dehydrogenase family protein [Nocardioides alcanivorans]|uniref:acyl-CoA dehydrogenase family protein n=1 Tax=Nocardioides alcanivorans TaxID=2897352 RepID=UPI001F3A4F3D|nr:acyl-CoA dehydrogenase family protein [Nocardioides alcanivorans]